MIFAIHPADVLEISVLEFNDQAGGNRRLCCQMLARSDWDGLTLHIPEKQFD